MKPTKEEIKKKYNISEDDFELLSSDDIPPTEELMKEGSMVEKLGWFKNFELWVKRSILTGALQAIILVGGFISAVEKIHEYSPLVYAKAEDAAEYVTNFASYQLDAARTYLISPANISTEEDRQESIELRTLAIYPTGTQFYPLSTQYKI